MEYIKCPYCEVNFIRADKEMCEVCERDYFKQYGDRDFSAARRGHGYGSNSRLVYEGFCKTLGWDREQAYNFGGQHKSLFAHNADTDRTKDVWFIFYVNTELDAAEVEKRGKSTNIITDGGDIIYEERYLFHAEKVNDRIIFVKEDDEYVFYGVYRYKGYDGKRRVFERYNDNYPIL